MKRKNARINVEGVRALIRYEISRFGSAQNLAKHWRISQPSISRILRGTLKPGPGVLKPLKLKRVVTIEYEYDANYWRGPEKP